MKPRIGVTSSPTLHEDRFLEALDKAFVTAVIRAGGVPFVLPVIEASDVDTVLACLDGILFAGGGDVDPARYDATASSATQGVDGGRDAFELALARAGRERGLPMLGVCRGSQILNVARGGGLVQHLPEVSEQQHCLKERWAEAVHTVRVLPDSRLSTVVGPMDLGVNSLHHQAVGRLGAGLHAVAWAEDGTVEAVEGRGSERLLGVQWHPELLVGDARHVALFEWLVEEAARPDDVAHGGDAPSAADSLGPGRVYEPA